MFYWVSEVVATRDDTDETASERGRRKERTGPGYMQLICAALCLTLATVTGLVLPDPVAAQSPADVAKQLRVEWEPVADVLGPPRLTGHIHNDSVYRIGSVRLRVETVDASNQVVNESLAWIYVGVPARGRAYFSVRRPAGETFRLTVESFVLIARETFHETP